LKKILSNLAFQVLLAIVAGALLGHFYPDAGVQMEIVGKTFVDIIKLFIGPIIFLTITIGIGAIGDLKKVGRVGIKALAYFEVVTTLALGIGVIVALVLKPGHIELQNLQSQDASKYTQAEKAFDWWQFLIANFTLQVLIIAIIAGVALSYASKRVAIILWLEKISAIVYKALRYVMYLAPLGAFGGIAFAVGKFGLESLVPLGKLMICVYITMALFVFIILALILRYFKFSIWKFLKLIKEELLIVLAASSSEAALPSLMNKLENLGCGKSVVGLVVPAGYSFNLDGTSIYLSMAVIFIAQLYGVELTYTELFTILGILMLTSKGAAGVTGSGFIVLASTLTTIHKIPVEGIAFLLGVDKFMSEARAITNIIGNGVATIVIAKSENEYHDQGMI
jgi:aerobic C4-dicarboxylate transport protein